MKLLVVRHAIAEEREDWAPRPDSARPLTRRGEERMKRAAVGLRHVVPELHTLLTSPLTRAAQTADIIAAAYGRKPAPRALHQLAAGESVEALVDALPQAGADDVVAVVGHEPDLSTLVGYLLTGQPRSFMEFRKGGACMLRFDGAAQAGAGMLLWVLTPRQLRDLSNL
jgi:phosphohistidine phosphatase